VRDNYSTARLLVREHLIDNSGYALDAIMASSKEFTASEVTARIRRDVAGSAYDVNVRRMIGQSVKDRPYDFVEAWIGYALLAKAAGYAGLAITVDEFEVEHFLSGAKLQRVRDLVDVLVRYFTGELGYRQSPLAVFFATVGEDGHRGDRIVDLLVEAGHGDYHMLSPWSPLDRVELARRIHLLYCEAYDLHGQFLADIACEVERHLDASAEADGGVIRAFIKAYVAALDSLHGPATIR
jgi:hypothetical protein